MAKKTTKKSVNAKSNQKEKQLKPTLQKHKPEKKKTKEHRSTSSLTGKSKLRLSKNRSKIKLKPSKKINQQKKTLNEEKSRKEKQNNQNQPVFQTEKNDIHPRFQESVKQMASKLIKIGLINHTMPRFFRPHINCSQSQISSKKDEAITKNTYKSKPINKNNHKKGQIKNRSRSQSMTPEKSCQIDVIQISSGSKNPLSQEVNHPNKTRRTGQKLIFSIPRENNQMSQKLSSSLSQGQHNNRNQKLKKIRIGKKEINGDFGQNAKSAHLGGRQYFVKNLYQESSEQQQFHQQSENEASGSILSQRASRSSSRNAQNSAVIIESQSSYPQQSQSQDNHFYNAQNSQSHQKISHHSRSIIADSSDIPQLSHDLHDNTESSSPPEPEYLVEKIVSVINKNGQTLYEVKWKGYSESQNTYEPIKNLQKVMAMVVGFERKERMVAQKQLKKKQKEIALKLKQITSVNKILTENNQKLEEITKKYEEVNAKAKELEKQKKEYEKMQNSQNLTNIQKQQEQKSQYLMVKSQFSQSNSRKRPHIDLSNQKAKLSQSQVMDHLNNHEFNQKRGPPAPLQLKIQPVIKLSIVSHCLKKPLNESNANHPKCEFQNSTKNSQENQQVVQKIERINEQKEQFSPEDYEKEEQYLLGKFMENQRQLGVECSQEIDFFESNPVYQLFEDSFKEKGLEMIVEEGHDEINLNLNLTSSSLMRSYEPPLNHDLQLVEYSFPSVGMEYTRNNKNESHFNSSKETLFQQEINGDFDCFNYYS